MAARYAEKLHIVPVFAPASSTATIRSYAVALDNSQWITFLINLGVMTSDSTDVATVTIVATDTLGNSSDAQDVAIPFSYRLSAAVASDNWGDITAATASGMTFNATDDGKSIVIDVDPASIPALHSTAKGVQVLIDAAGLISNVATSITALIEDRYPQNEHLSST
jgi:hypothetical protein